MFRVAWFSTASNKILTRSTAYTRAVLCDPLPGFDIELFVGDEDYRDIEQIRSTVSIPVYHYLHYAVRQQKSAFDLCIYNLEDSVAAGFCLLMQAIYPGLCFMHDCQFNEIVLSRYAHFTTGFDLNRLLERVHGKSSIAMGDLLVRGIDLEAFSYFHPLGLDELNELNRYVFFSHAGRRRILQKNAEDSVYWPYFPGLNDTAQKVEMSDAKAAINVGSFIGHVLEDCADDVISAMAKLIELRKEESVNSVLCCFSKNIEQSLLKRLHRLGTRAITIRCIESQEQMSEVISGFDIMLAPRFSNGASITLPILQALNSNVFVVTTDSGAEGEITHTKIVKVRGGRDLSTRLVDATIRILNKKSVRQADSKEPVMCPPICATPEVRAKLNSLLANQVSEMEKRKHIVESEIQSSKQNLCEKLYRQFCAEELVGKGEKSFCHQFEQMCLEFNLIKERSL